MIEAVDRILVVDTPIVSDTSIQKENLISIFPSSGSSLNQHGEINFVIETCDQYLHLHKSYIYMECELLKPDDTVLAETDEVSLTNNAPMFLFDRSTYSMDGMQVESIMDPGRASLMKGLLTYSSTMNKQNTFGWILETKDIITYKINKYTKNRKGSITFCIPLTHMFGFAECYNKIVYGRKHQLTLYRSPENKNSITSNDAKKHTAKINIKKLQWIIPKIVPSLEMQNKLLNIFESSKLVQMPFISRQLESYNIPNGNREFTWKLGTKYDKIKYIVVALQSNRDNNYLNAERYPHDCLKFDFDKFNAVQQYNFAKEFRNSYYESTKDYIFMEEDVYYYYYPLLVFDVSKQNDRIIQSRPDVTIKASFSKSIVQNTKCYCLIMSENIVEIKDNRVKVVSV
ncbi:Protein CBG24325 [Caenorhabditis briggsae]|uniref:Protein CBG24325 n=1 Tax=Caenorhabditis briggsae TaxID=6238 RepID=A8WKG7_CAEBR|nr:Protein CBG24325 [Caenorhabditis briggsae]CAP20962.1 Protein CBG24325 [Caenorhabditis briggsae]